MAIREKLFIPHNTYFVTFTIVDWLKIFTDNRYFDLVYRWFDYMADNYGNRIRGYVIMPNHIHILLYITDKSPILSKLIQNGKRFLAYGIVSLLTKDGQINVLNQFASKADQRKNAKHKVFQERYDSKLVDGDLFIEKLEYIHNNPCQEKWRLVEKPEDYIHASTANYFFGKGIYPVEVIY